MRSTGLAMALLALAGCKGCREEAVTPFITVLDGTIPESMLVAPTVGSGQLEVPVLVLNAYSAPILASGLSIVVDGPTAFAQNASISPDSWGYATARVTTDGPEAFTVTAGAQQDGASDSLPTTCWSTPLPPADFGLLPAWPLQGIESPGITAVLTGGLLVVDTGQVWFSPTGPGLPPHPVLQLTSPIMGALAVSIDSDGVQDALVWNETEVVVMRGRPSGGLGWGAGFSPANGMNVVGVSAGDVNGDAFTDLAIALSNNADSYVVFIEGDGVWGFKEAENVPFLGVGIQDIVLEANDAAVAALNLLDSTNQLIRFTLGEAGWSENYREPLNLDMPTHFLGAADLNNGGTDDLTMVGPAIGDSQRVLFVTTDGGRTNFSLSYSPFNAAMGDVSGDGTPDLLFLENAQLQIVTHDDETEDFVQRNVGAMPQSAPIAVGELYSAIGDLPDLAVIADAAYIFPGQSGTESGQWLPADEVRTSYGLVLASEPTLLDLEDDGVVDAVLAVAGTAGALSLQTWTVERTKDGVDLLTWGTTPLAAGLALTDFVYCDAAAWVLTSDGGLERYTFDAKPPDPVATGGLVTGGDRLVCGDFDLGGVVGVASAEGLFQVYDATVGLVSEIQIGKLDDVVAGDVDGDGIDTAITCTGTDCSVLAVDLDGDGLDEVFTADRGVLGVSGWGGQATYAGTGLLSASDTDGDGFLDVVGTTDANTWVWRGVVGGIAPAFGFHSREDVLGKAVFGDISGDGLPDLLRLNSAGDLLIMTAR